MAFVIHDSCIRCVHTDCVEVCPMDCIHQGANMLAIDPDNCIDCGACETECPELAIQIDDELVGTAREYWIDVNAIVTGRTTVAEADTSAWPAELRARLVDPVAPWPVIDTVRPHAHPDQPTASGTPDRARDFDPRPAGHASADSAAS